MNKFDDLKKVCLEYKIKLDNFVLTEKDKSVKKFYYKAVKNVNSWYDFLIDMEKRYYPLIPHYKIVTKKDQKKFKKLLKGLFALLGEMVINIPKFMLGFDAEVGERSAKQ